MSDDVDANEALAGFRRFPTWMWRNTEVVEFVEWLRARNDASSSDDQKVGFYGLDLYSLRASMKAVLQFLEKVDPEAAKRARLVKNAEEYYRTMFLRDVSSWNLRDRHMVETLEALVAHLDRQGGPPKVAVWEHNSHLGDARATEMGQRGELNVGQLLRERYGREAVLIGFTTHHGTVTAASDWDGPAERKNVRPALAGSYEALFHDALPDRFLLPLRADDPAKRGLSNPRLERAIGVIYRPETERMSHYFRARLPDQFEAVLHFEETRAVEPLERSAGWETGEVPETFPFEV
jgi:erythromycin esterase-like protein